MPARIVLDELILSLTIPANCPDDEAKVIRRVLFRGGFVPKLRQVVRELIREYEALHRVQASVRR